MKLSLDGYFYRCLPLSESGVPGRVGLGTLFQRVTGRSILPCRLGCCGCTKSCGGGFVRSRVGVLADISCYKLPGCTTSFNHWRARFWRSTCYSGDFRLQSGRCLYKVGIGWITIHGRWSCWFWASVGWRSSRSRSSCGGSTGCPRQPEVTDGRVGVQADEARASSSVRRHFKRERPGRKC